MVDPARPRLNNETGGTLKDNRASIVDAIRALSYRDSAGRLFSPTLTDICRHLGLSPASKGSISVKVSELVAEGVLIRFRDGDQSLAVVDPDDRRLNDLVAAAERVKAPEDRRRAFAEVLAVHG